MWIKIKKLWYVWVTGGAVIALGAVVLPANPIDTYDEMLQVQQAYFQTHGEYLQIIPDNRLPHYIPGTVKEKIGENVGPNWRVNIYETPRKEYGFQAYWEDANYQYSKGAGPESSSRDYTSPKPVNVASTTGWILPKLPKFTLDIPSLFNEALAALSGNSYSTDLEKDSTQTWSITDANQQGLDLSANFTIALWIRIETLAGTHGLVSKWDTVGDNRSWEWLWDSSNIFQINVDDNGATPQVCNVDQAWTPNAATWYHVAIIKDGTSVTHYVDGASIGSGTCTGGSSIFNGASAFIIGARNAAGTTFDGIIDDVRVWSRTLTSEEIRLLYNDSCNFPNGTALQGYWKLNNDELDFSNNTNDLTNNNTATFVRDWSPDFRCKQAIYFQG